MNTPKHSFSTSQVKMLRAARDHGDAFANTTPRQRPSHARMALRLQALGFLRPSSTPGLTLTEFGRQTLEEMLAGGIKPKQEPAP